MNNYSIPQSEKYINPNRVNTTKFITIFSDDPRNNPKFLKENPFTTVIDASKTINNVVQIDNLYNIDPTFPVPVTEPDPDPGTDNPNSNSDLQAPSNLAVKNFELKLGTDGTAYYLATITFDDVPNAESYEAVLEIAT